MPIIDVNIMKILNLLNIFFGIPNFKCNTKKIDSTEKLKKKPLTCGLGKNVLQHSW